MKLAGSMQIYNSIINKLYKLINLCQCSSLILRNWSVLRRSRSSGPPPRWCTGWCAGCASGTSSLPSRPGRGSSPSFNRSDGVVTDAE